MAQSESNHQQALRKVIACYSHKADELSEQYEALSAQDVHAQWARSLPKAPGLVLDVGAGSGRDAAWLCSLGFDVVAVEPAQGLREKGLAKYRHLPIQWIDDSLPSLKTTLALNYRFDLILVSAVFMHLHNVDDRKRAFRKLTSLLKPGGRLVITLRHGPSPKDRPMVDVASDELLALGRTHALEAIDFGHSKDVMGREDVSWSYVMLQSPDDGTGALPLLRHLILLDDKSSTYKLALLRVLVRIADSCRGAVLRRNDEFVTLPFGLVALYWIKIYKSLLLDNQFRQQPGNQNCGFAKAAFYNLDQIGHDLRLGAVLTGQRARILFAALRDARNTIKTMPARYLTLPREDNPVFPCHSNSLRISDSITLDLPFLSAFGEFHVPTHLWDAMTHYACWIEPAINNEWCQIMQGYHRKQGEQVGLGELFQALTWKNDERSTTEVRSIVERMKSNGQAPSCVWTGSLLVRAKYEVDHCFPYANWFNNDLWNLMPATEQANGSKSNKLPAGELLLLSKGRILSWWDGAYQTPVLEGRFYTEAVASLPGIRERSLNAVFEGVVRQRVHLKHEQSMPEWGSDE
ncbi:methyltransferase domain-containing protein [Sansalvadorimonas verongulae]|uniref:methyltransferase domain-containing protein n=1 Tax=Sansalvadorimonas verongulae TaxID=2172824 RepID=UPI0012BC19F4|nr:methyltransferase domain-containing protein [Sansalvadorimonas verongulae]MTI12955.1 methyltransferase domain-containing protein [Sansalvadorimonas verongulae]